MQGIRGNGKAPATDHLRRRSDHIHRARRCQHRHWAVHRKVHARIDDTRRDQRHDGDKGLHQHPAVADKTSLPFICQHLRRGAGRNQRMEARNRPAGNGNKQEWEQVARPHRTGTVNEFGQRRHGQRWTHDQNAHRQADNGTNLQEGRQVVARRQQQPDRQHGGDKAITHQHPGQLYAGKVKVRCPGWAFSHPAAGNNGKHQEYQADNRHLTNATRTQIAQVNAHKDRQRDSERYGVGSPRAVGQCFHDDHRQHREDNHHDHKTGHQRNHTRRRAHLFFHQFAQGTAIATGGDKQHHKVLHRARQHHPGQ